MARIIPKLRHIIKINDITPTMMNKWSPAECETRRILASCYRLTHLLGWDDLIYGHITSRVPDTEDEILINPYGLHYTEITAANLVKMKITTNETVDPGNSKFPYQPTGGVIHSAIHANRPDLHTLFHMHSREGISLATAVEKMEPICQSSTELGEVCYHDFRGVIFQSEDKEPLSRDFPKPHKTLIMRNHGLLTGGQTVEEAFNRMYFLWQVCQTYVDAGYTSGPVPDRAKINEKILQQSTQGFEECRLETAYGVQEFEALCRLLDYQGLETGYPYSEASKHFMRQTGMELD